MQNFSWFQFYFFKKCMIVRVSFTPIRPIIIKSLYTRLSVKTDVILYWNDFSLILFGEVCLILRGEVQNMQKILRQPYISHQKSMLSIRDQGNSVLLHSHSFAQGFSGWYVSFYYKWRYQFNFPLKVLIIIINGKMSLCRQITDAIFTEKLNWLKTGYVINQPNISTMLTPNWDYNRPIPN